MARVDRRGLRPERWTREVSGRLCECGCGRPTMVSPKSDAARGWVRGEPRRFVRGHSSRVRPFRLRVVLVRGLFRVEDRGYATPCKVWLGGVDKHGYGKRRWGRGRRTGAHRVAYMEAFGAIPAGHDVHHNCEVPLCCEPSHLQALTPEAHQAWHGEARHAAR